MIKEIYLIRHGQVQANEEGLLGGQLDQSLSEMGKAQVKKIDVSLFTGFDSESILISSPLKRAIETAKILFPTQELLVNPMFAEFDNGDYSHLKVEAVKKINPQFSQHANFPDLSYPNGESLTQFFKRVTEGLAFYQSKNLGNLVLVAHGGVINVILHTILQTALQGYPRFEIPNAGVTRLSFDESFGFYRLRYLGNTQCIQ